MFVACVGDNILDVYTRTQTEVYGGNTLNVAVALHDLGVSVLYVGSVGDDKAGRELKRHLASRGMRIDGIETVRGKPTGFAMVHHDSNGDRYFGEYDRGASQLELSERQIGLIEEADLIHTSYSSALEDEIANLAQLANVSFDFDEHRGDPYARRLLPHITHAFFSGSQINQSETTETATRAFSYGVKTVTVTHGAEGASHFRDGRVWFQPSAPVVPIDTLGAGDAFIAATIAGICRDQPPDEYLALAARRSAQTCAVVGGTDMYLVNNSMRRR